VPPRSTCRKAVNSECEFHFRPASTSPFSPKRIQAKVEHILAGESKTRLRSCLRCCSSAHSMTCSKRVPWRSVCRIAVPPYRRILYQHGFIGVPWGAKGYVRGRIRLPNPASQVFSDGGAESWRWNGGWVGRTTSESAIHRHEDFIDSDRVVVVHVTRLTGRNVGVAEADAHHCDDVSNRDPASAFAVADAGARRHSYCWARCRRRRAKGRARPIRLTELRRTATRVGRLLSAGRLVRAQFRAGLAPALAVRSTVRVDAPAAAVGPIVAHDRTR
jgi:hypothetical protein